MARVRQFEESAILEKAMHLFWQKGYHATSVQDLVDELGINRASMYQTFGGKEELFLKALRAYMRDIGQRMVGIMETAETVTQGLERLFGEIAGGLADDPFHRGCFMVNSTTEWLPGESLTRDQIDKGREWEIGLFTSYIRKGVEQGEFPPDLNPESIAIYLYTLHCGLTVLSKVEHEPDTLRTVARNALAVFR